MEILGRSRAVSNTNVSLLHDFSISHIRRCIRSVTQLKETFQSGRRVLGTIAIVAVRQEHDKSILNIPFRFSRDDFGVDHNLSSVSEISELGFPKAESVRVSLGISIFESKYGVLRQVRSSRNEVSYTTSVGDNRVDRNIRAISVLIEDMSVSVREGSSLNILSR